MLMRAGFFLSLFQFPLNTDVFFASSLYAVCIPEQRFTLIWYCIDVVQVSVYAWNLFDLSNFYLFSFESYSCLFIRCHSIDFPLLSKFRSSHPQIHFISTLFALRVTASTSTTSLMIRWHFCLCFKTISIKSK